MLILTRRVGESVFIDNPSSETTAGNSQPDHLDPVQVTVLGVKGNQVRIGIAAPKNIHIVREELLEKG